MPEKIVSIQICFLDVGRMLTFKKKVDMWIREIK